MNRRKMILWLASLPVIGLLRLPKPDNKKKVVIEFDLESSKRIREMLKYHPDAKVCPALTYTFDQGQGAGSMYHLKAEIKNI